ncbi:tRNA (guanine46-N7-)-methyltransferase [hydrothermal vent metagenome]|uniref:tRNA (guanine(46)-N(7))-methyltransferase n=1 Tax=hydrothermal vent metagenome TaxID=652676 RepID=A0A1W1EJC1_9ZZZZ
MPHIKVKPFNLDIIENSNQLKNIIKFRAKGDDELYGIEYKGEEFLINIKSDNNDNIVIKYDKVSRPLNVELLKEVIGLISKTLNLDIISSNIDSKANTHIITSKYLKKVKDFENIEFGDKKVALEVGFGSGKHILHQANNNRDKLYIGIEIHTPSATQLLKQIKIQELDNIWVVNYDARLLLEMFPSNSLEEIFVHFPVPWDKKPHRRVISKSFLEESLRVLKPSHRLELRTDSDRYFWYSLETFFNYPKISVDVIKNRDLEVVSKYEARWRRENKDIYDVLVTSDELSNESNREYSFEFRDINFNKNLKDKLPKTSQLFDGYFIHFERNYDIENGLLIKCAFGSFDRPEHKYILIDNSIVRYISSSPVSTSLNYKAHKQIEEYLNV